MRPGCPGKTTLVAVAVRSAGRASAPFFVVGIALVVQVVAPRAQPQQQRIVFDSRASGDAEVWSMSVDGSDVRI